MFAFVRTALSVGLFDKPSLSVSRRHPPPLSEPPVHWLIGFSPPGGPVDIVARIMSQWLSEHLGQQLSWRTAPAPAAISRRGSYQFAAGRLHAVVVAPNNAISKNVSLQEMPYDFIRDTVPRSRASAADNMLVVSNAMPVKTVQDSSTTARPIRARSPMPRRATHPGSMSAELFKAMTKIDMVHVPYRGSALAFPDIISNKVQLIFDNLPSALEQARGGSVRALASPRRSAGPAYPIFRLAEPCPGFESVGFYGISAPKGTPPEIVEILNKAVGRR